MVTAEELGVASAITVTALPLNFWPELGTLIYADASPLLFIFTITKLLFFSSLPSMSTTLTENLYNPSFNFCDVQLFKVPFNSIIGCV